MKRIKLIEMPKEEVRLEELEKSLVSAGSDNDSSSTECGSCEGGLYCTIYIDF